MAMLDADDCAAPARGGRTPHYRPGASIIIQGDHTDTLFVIRTGWVKITLVTADGHEILLTVLGPGEVFGEFEAIRSHGRAPRRQRVALDAVECQVFTAEEIQQFLTAHPRAAYVLLRSITRRLLVGIGVSTQPLGVDDRDAPSTGGDESLGAQPSEGSHGRLTRRRDLAGELGLRDGELDVDPAGPSASPLVGKFEQKLSQTMTDVGRPCSAPIDRT